LAKLTIRVQPGARRNGLAGRVGDEWKLAVTAPPADGRANEAAAELLADLLGAPRSAVTLLHGAASRRKTFEIRDLTADEIERRLNSL